LAAVAAAGALPAFLMIGSRPPAEEEADVPMEEEVALKA
jgi:hypothetical protein